tara:strand:- start:1981 stop:2238 length:258 start_codon:yes stop_codon:yes gene_type:complete
MARPKASADLAPRVRGAFKRALIMLDERKGVTEEGKGLSEILCDSLEDNPIGTLGAISRFCPKELDVDLNADIDGEIHITWQVPS